MSVDTRCQKSIQNVHFPASLKHAHYNHYHMKTELAFILDRSGSMGTIRVAAIEGFNTFLRNQKEAKDESALTLVLFDTKVEAPIRSITIADIAELTEETYEPSGNTALLDAIGLTIDKLGEKFAALPVSEQPEHVTIAILTDGEENSSKRYTWEQVADRISHQTEKYGWEFLFLGAGSDAIATASRMNIHPDNFSAYVADEAGQVAASAATSRKSIASRAVKFGFAEDSHFSDAKMSLRHMLKEEDEKRR